MSTLNQSNIVGYGVCGKDEKYLKGTLDCFKTLCDHTIIATNNTDKKSIDLIKSYGFEIIEDNREWGVYQNRIKQDLMEHVAKYNPKYCVCLDMDEVFDTQITKQKLISLLEKSNALYFYMLNLWGDGWNRQWSFWNIRAWTWNGDVKFFNKPLHCGLAPEWCYYYASYAPYFVKHYGLKLKEDRDRKIERYKKYDPKAQYKDKSYYEALESDSFEVLDEDKVREALIKEVGTQTRRNMSLKKEPTQYYVRRITNGVDTGLIEVSEKILQEVLKRNPTWINEGIIGKDSKEYKTAIKENECVICGLKLDTPELLNQHKAKHV